MRSVTFVQRITLEVPGSVAQCGIYLGDVNSDGDNELVVATTDGEIYIYRGEAGEVWKRCSSNLGFLTAISVGDILNIGRNVLIAASGCGWLYVFDFSLYGDEEEEIEPTFRQRVPANIRDMIISDTNSDGSRELVVSLTDRVVRIYRWQEGEFPSPTPPANPAPDYKDSSFSSSNQSNNSISSSPFLSSGENLTAGRFICKNKWEFASQIGTITFNMDTTGNPAILVGQPGGAFMRLRCKQSTNENTPSTTSEEIDGRSAFCTARNKTLDGSSAPGIFNKDGTDETDGIEDGMTTPEAWEYEPLGISRRSNPNVSSEILGGFHSGKPDHPGTRYAIVTLDGSVLLVDDTTGKNPVDSIMWNLQVDHQLMCLSKLDVTGNGLEEVICCSWDGQTYIITQDKQAVRFKFEDAVSTFTAGMYSLTPGHSEPVLVYVTFNNTIQIYYDLDLDPDLTLSSLIHYPPMLKEGAEALHRLGIDPSNLRQLQQVYSYCLYALPGDEDA